MKKLILFVLSAFMFVSCADKVSPEDERPPHMQDQEQETPPAEEPDDTPTEVPNEPVEGAGASMTLRVMSYNVGVFSKYKTELGHYSYPEVAQVIKDLNVGVVGMNETDNNRKRTEYQYQAKELAKVLGTGWTYYFASAADATYGNSIVASPDYKVVKEWPKVTIPKGGGSEIRSMGVVEYEDFVFCVAHLDHTNLEARLAGEKIITDWAKKNFGAGKTTKPVIMLGDMNCLPSEETIKKFKENWTLVSSTELTFPNKPSASPTKCIDFIFVLNNNVKFEAGESHAVTSSRHASVSLASDHLPMYADITFKKQK